MPDSNQRPLAISRGNVSPLLLGLVLVAYGILFLIFSHQKMLNLDEIMVLQTDSQAHLADVFRTQTSYPISLDPLGYHDIEHLFLMTFGLKAWALRLPSMLSFLGAMACLYCFAKRSAGVAAGCIAGLFPLLTAALAYAVEARPYAMLLFLAAGSLLVWQRLDRGDSGTLLQAVLLAILLSLSVNVHFYGVFILLVLGVAEFYRFLRYRRVLLAAMIPVVVGTASLALTLPVLRASLPFKEHYYSVRVDPIFIGNAYSYFLMGTTRAGVAVCGALVLGLVAVVVITFRNLRTSLSEVELVAVLTTVSLPVFGFLLGHFVTHTIEQRAVIITVAGLSLLAGIGFGPWLQQRGKFGVVLAFMVVLSLAQAGLRIRNQHKVGVKQRAQIARLHDLVAVAAATSNGHIYIADGTWAEVLSVYGDDDVARLVVFLYSEPMEIRFLHTNTSALTAEHLSHFSRVRTADFATLDGGSHLIVTDDPKSEWSGPAIAQQKTVTRDLGPYLDGNAVMVTFPK